MECFFFLHFKSLQLLVSCVSCVGECCVVFQFIPKVLGEVKGQPSLWDQAIVSNTFYGVALRFHFTAAIGPHYCTISSSTTPAVGILCALLLPVIYFNCICIVSILILIVYTSNY